MVDELPLWIALDDVVIRPEPSVMIFVVFRRFFA